MLQATRAGISAFAAFSQIATGLGVSRAVLADGLRALTVTGPARPCARYTGPVSGSTAEPGHQAGARWALALLTEASRGGSAAAAAGPLGQYRGRPRQPTLGGMTSTPPSTEATMTSLDRRADVSHEGKERTPIAMSIPAIMCALQQTSLNGPEDLRLITGAPVPNPGPGEVLIRVTAAGVNFVDISQARGIFAGGPQPPYLAGIEGAGEITAVGEGVTGLEPGAHVIGVGIGGGAFAEYMVLPAAAAVRVPAGWADEQALGLVVSWPTALAALKPLGRIAAGQTVLIHAAAGATGQAGPGWCLIKPRRGNSGSNFFLASRRGGVLSGRARPSFPRVALATTRRETRRPMTSKTTTAGSDADRQAVLDVLARVDQAWEAGDAEAFVAGYTEDASVIQPGVYEKDREEIRTTMAAAFAGPLKGSRVAARPVDVRFLTGDTAIVVSEDGIIFAGQDAVASERLVRATWVLVRRDGGWRIASYHNSPAS